MSDLYQIEPEGEDLSRFSVSAGSSCTLGSPVSYVGNCAAAMPQISESCVSYQII